MKQLLILAIHKDEVIAWCRENFGAHGNYKTARWQWFPFQRTFTGEAATRIDIYEEQDLTVFTLRWKEYICDPR